MLLYYSSFTLLFRWQTQENHLQIRKLPHSTFNLQALWLETADLCSFTWATSNKAVSNVIIIIIIILCDRGSVEVLEKVNQS